jgi:hypothetical protein
MNILSKTTGYFVFILENMEQIEFSDWNDIPEDFKFKHVIKFLPELPPPPHTPEQHMEVSEWNDRLQALMEIERNARSN